MPMSINEINSRVINEPQWPEGGFRLTRPMAERNYDINAYGFPIASTPTGLWQRGAIVRRYQPVMHPPTLGYFAYDPTDPSTWHQSQH